MGTDLSGREVRAEAHLSRALRFFGVVALVGCLAAVSLVVLAKAATGMLQAGETAPVSEIDLNPLPQRSVVLASDGSLIAVLHREQNRKSIPLTEVPQVVVDTVLAVEDAAFYEHGGMNLRATARALATNVSAGDVLQGGSTITQQLVKNALLTPKQDLGRKVEEAVLAVRLEDQMTKDEILERYLNTVYFGNGAYGLQAAAELYFGVDAAALDQGGAAFLAGLIRNPIGYDPFVYPEVAKDRRDLVLERLLAVDQLETGTADQLRRTPVPTEPRNSELLPKPQDYFIEEVTQRLLADPRLGETQTERYNALFLGGLTIKTTLDPRLQTLAEEAVAATIPEPGGEFTASVVSVEPGTGAVRALVGGRGFETDKYNIATQGVGQQPGSSFKPFVLATAIENGISPQSTVDGRGPCAFPNPGGIPDPYELENFEGSAGGVLSLTDATRSSVNCAYVRLGKIVGLDKVADTASRLGITTPVNADLSMPLGTNEVLPIDMAGAYASFAADGMHYQPYLVDEVVDQEGTVLLTGASEGTQAISEAAARLTTEVLEGVVSGGTATRARFADRRPVAGKTGTTSAYSDAWFVGYTPQLSTAVWMGSPSGNVEMTNVGGVRVTGGSYPAKIWQAYMGPALA
ncbi:MAG: transglycosylase domain-containing protein, partial [Actinomycetota bacterium]|nr:transglycosylase domain-containing protein [Actinomycetota bacterium]